MNENIFIPKRINVGYQKRLDTYTGRLAYVDYYDEKGKQTHIKSWEAWRDKDITNEEFDNVPTVGFVLNKKAGDYKSGWNHRQAYCRVYDPRGFEMEITIENLLYILENTNCIKGKGLTGEFVYGWSGKQIILIPVESPDYKEFMEYTNIIQDNKTVKAKDLIVGATYESKDKKQLIYLGRFDCYKGNYKYIKDNDTYIVKKYSSIPKDIIVDDKYTIVLTNDGKHYWFASVYEYRGKKSYEYIYYKSVPKTLIKCIDNRCVPELDQLLQRLESNKHYSCPNYNIMDIIKYTFDEFKAITNPSSEHMRYNRLSSYGIFSDNLIVYALEKRKDGLWTVIPKPGDSDRSLMRHYGFEQYNYTKEDYINDFKERFNGNARITRSRYPWGEDTITLEMEPLTLEELYNKLKPVYIETYLNNGNRYKSFMKYINGNINAVI